jgi:hypothetical protein
MTFFIVIAMKTSNLTTPQRFIKPTQHYPPMRVNVFHALNLSTCALKGQTAVTPKATHGPEKFLLNLIEDRRISA